MRVAREHAAHMSSFLPPNPVFFLSGVCLLCWSYQEEKGVDHPDYATALGNWAGYLRHWCGPSRLRHPRCACMECHDREQVHRSRHVELSEIKPR